MATGPQLRDQERAYREEAVDLSLLLLALIATDCAFGPGYLPAVAYGILLILGAVFVTRGATRPRGGWRGFAARIPGMTVVALGAAALFRLWLDIPWKALAFVLIWAAAEALYRLGWVRFEPSIRARIDRFWTSRLRPLLQEILLSESVAERGKLRGADIAAVGLGIALTFCAYLWTLLTVNPTLIEHDPLGHYAYLTDALLSGQLHFKLEPDPRLLQLANPYFGWQGVPRLHDATLYHGHYYTYFGVTPVVLLFAPWHLLTGSFLNEGVASVVFAFVGFLIATGLWVAARRRFFPRMPASLLGAGVLMLGLGNYVFELIQTPDVYEVPISCAFACLMAAFAFLARAVSANEPRRQANALGLAGLAWGLAVGARPDYLISLPVFFILAAGVWLRANWTGKCASDSALPLAIRAVLPLAAVGFGLAAYNWFRFGSIFETGIKYQLASMDERGVALVQLSNIRWGLRAYLLPAPNYSLYFPFLSRRGDTFGLLPWAPFAVASLGLPLTWLSGRLRKDRVWVLAGGAVLLTAVLNFGTICSFWFIQDRYALDFLPAAIGAGLLAFAAAFEIARSRGAFRLLVLALGVAAGLTLVQSVLLGFKIHTMSGLDGVARFFDLPADVAERFFGPKPGPVSMKILFADSPVETRQPLLATADGADVLFLRQPDRDHVQFGLYHRGSGGPLSRLVTIDPRKTHDLVADLGSLYPPAEDSAFAGWPRDLIAALRRRAIIRLDGQTVLDSSAIFYPNDALHTFIGRNPDPADVSDPAFGGRIWATSRQGIPSPSAVAEGVPSGPVRLSVQFPVFRAAYGEPLVSTGPNGAGDLVYVTYLGPGLVRFGHDCSGFGAVETEPVTIDPDAVQVIDIDLGSLDSAPSGPDGQRAPFRLRLNGRLLISAIRPFHPTAPYETAFGFNAAGSSAAAPTFSGTLVDVGHPKALFER